MERIYLIIFGMALVTYLPRMLPLVVLNKVDLPPVVLSWLRLIPPAVLGALTAQSIFLRNGDVVFTWRNVYFLAALPCFIIAFRTKSLMWTVAVGMISVVLLHQLKPIVNLF